MGNDSHAMPDPDSRNDTERDTTARDADAANPLLQPQPTPGALLARELCPAWRCHNVWRVQVGNDARVRAFHRQAVKAGEQLRDMEQRYHDALAQHQATVTRWQLRVSELEARIAVLTGGSQPTPETLTASSMPDRAQSRRVDVEFTPPQRNKPDNKPE